VPMEHHLTPILDCLVVPLDNYNEDIFTNIWKWYIYQSSIFILDIILFSTSLYQEYYFSIQ
jgi:hypothetical protein